MLGLAVPVLVPRISRPGGDADGEEGEQRRDEVGAGVERLRDEPEAPGGEAGDELERDQRGRGEHGDERGAALRAHGRRLVRNRAPSRPRERAG